MPQPNTPEDSSDHLIIRLGKHFEASARGKLAVLVVALALAMILATTSDGVLTYFLAPAVP